jgi:hypothetical protein
MAVPRGAFSRPFMHTPPSRDHGDGNVLAVGWRVRVTSPAGRGHRVSLTDSEGTTTVTTLPDGTEVEILAWRPRRSGATLYRVQPTSGGKEGWLSGSSLKAPPAPAPQKVRPIAAARPQPASKSAPKAVPIPKAVSKPVPKPVSKAASKTVSRATATKTAARTSRRKTAR